MLKKLNRRSSSQSSNIERPTSLVMNPHDQPSLPTDQLNKNRARKFRLSKVSGARLLSIPDMPKGVGNRMLGIPDISKLRIGQDGDTPKEMIPVLTFLAAHGSRPYTDGYFMVLNELDSEGQPIKDRKWTEVFASLQGTIITMWDAAKLDQGVHEVSFINITDGHMRSVDSLGPDLQNVIVMSTTMKNRYIFQFGTKKLFNEWSAAFRLAVFERTSLQEAYTGALLSSKGSKMHGIQQVLHESKQKIECWCNVRFGIGMPWKRVWTVIIPNIAIKDKKTRKSKQSIGMVEFYSDQKKDKKKKPLAVIHQAFNAFAIFPEKAVLMDSSTLIKMDCMVEFDGENDFRETSVFMMPEPLPHTQGFETLIRFLIPLYDIFGLYGRPKRLNADKNDINSLLFAMPSLPRIYYLDVIDLYMLASLPESQKWSNSEWSMKIKELLARKLAVGFRGTGNVNQVQESTGDSGFSSSRNRRLSSSSNLQPPNLTNDNERPRAVSEPQDITRPFLASNLTGSSGELGNNTLEGSPYTHSRPAPKAPADSKQFGSAAAGTLATGSATSTPSANASTTALPPAGQINRPPAGTGIVAESKPRQAAAPMGPRAFNAPSHQRINSDSNTYQNGLLSPQLNGTATGLQMPSPSGVTDKRNSKISVASGESFASASEQLDRGDKRPVAGYGLAEEKSQLFDPTYRPEHLSYADYSEYMHHYLQNISQKVPDEKVSDPVREAREKAEIRPSTPPSKSRAQLLDTPIRTPAISLNNVSPSEAAREESPAQHTALSAPRIGAYPNAPGSPSVPKAVDQRKPSGPRPNPDSKDKNPYGTYQSGNAQTTAAPAPPPVAVAPANNASATQAQATQAPVTQFAQASVVQVPSPQQASMYQSHYATPGAQSSPSGPRAYAPLQTPAGMVGTGPPRQGSPSMPYRTGNPYQSQDPRAMQGGPGTPVGNRPAGSPAMGSPMGSPGMGPHAMAPHSAHPPMFAPNAVRGPMGPPQMNYGMAGGMNYQQQVPNPYWQTPASYPQQQTQQQPQSNFTTPTNNPYAAAAQAAGSSNPGMSFNQSRQQQLKSTRAKAMDSSAFGI